jgi:aminoglycoside/choline kinase family phosphotransferase
VAWSHEHFPALDPLACSVESLTAGGSDRRYFRLSWRQTDRPTFHLVLMLYTLARSDNGKFMAATRTLQNLGVRVPNIHAFDEGRLAIWLQDLGDVDLYSKRTLPWLERKPLYLDALDQVARLHRCGANELDESSLRLLEPPFDTALYRWEQEYFTQHLLRTHLGVQGDLPKALTEGFDWLREHLAGQERRLVHRDFQSRNLMVVGDQSVWLIDHQGLRLGLPGYDLASLLYDPYVELSQPQRHELLQAHADNLGLELAELQMQMLQCAAQRLAQALGAYANLSHHLGKPEFARHIPAALQRLIAVLEQLPALQPAAQWLRQFSTTT